MSNMKFVTLTGKKTGVEDEIELTEIPAELKGFIKSHKFNNAAFRHFAKDDAVAFNVNVIFLNNGKVKSLKVSANTVELLEDTPKDNGHYEGWREIENVWFAPEELELMGPINAILDAGGYVNLQYLGPSGYGKTVRAEAWAKQRGANFLAIDCALQRNPETWFIMRAANEKGTYEETMTFADCFVKGDAVILLDEINRVAPAIKAPLMPILDDRRKTTVLKQEFVGGGSILFIATRNQGYQYVATYEMDAAEINRFDVTLTVKAPPNAVEARILTDRFPLDRDTAEEIVLKLHELRQLPRIQQSNLDVTTRTALKIGKLVFNGLNMRSAFKMAVINNVVDDFELSKIITDVVQQ